MPGPQCAVSEFEGYPTVSGVLAADEPPSGARAPLLFAGNRRTIACPLGEGGSLGLLCGFERG
jgi:hypothetical protein